MDQERTTIQISPQCTPVCALVFPGVWAMQPNMLLFPRYKRLPGRKR